MRQNVFSQRISAQVVQFPLLGGVSGRSSARLRGRGQRAMRQVFWLVPRGAAFPVRSQCAPNQWPMWRNETIGHTAAGLHRILTCFPYPHAGAKVVLKFRWRGANGKFVMFVCPRGLSRLNSDVVAVRRTSDTCTPYDEHMCIVRQTHVHRTTDANFHGDNVDDKGRHLHKKEHLSSSTPGRRLKERCPYFDSACCSGYARCPPCGMSCAGWLTLWRAAHQLACLLLDLLVRFLAVSFVPRMW